MAEEPMETQIDAKTMAEARERMRHQMGAAQRAGKKGAARMAPRARATETVGEDKAKQLLKKFNFTSISAIDEIILGRQDQDALFFKNPKVLIDPRNNVTIIQGCKPEEKPYQPTSDLLQQILMAQAAGNIGPSLGGPLSATGGEDDVIPELIEDFETVATAGKDGGRPAQEEATVGTKIEEVD